MSNGPDNYTREECEAGIERMYGERCRECSGELSDCGEITIDGPTKDCQLCQLRDKYHELRCRAIAVVSAHASYTGGSPIQYDKILEELIAKLREGLGTIPVPKE